MTIDIIPLGISSAVPAHGRHLSGTALVREGRVLLFDCGEGTQFQMMAAGVKKTRVEAIFLTHLHGDHFYGLMGLLSTMGMQQRKDPLTVVGPQGVKQSVEDLLGRGNQDSAFPIEFKELAPEFTSGIVYRHPGYTVEAHRLDHRIFTVGFRFQEKDWPGRINGERAKELGIRESRQFKALREGRSVTLEDGRVVEADEVVGPERPGAAFAYITDTRPCAGSGHLAHDADLVYHEATFTQDMEERARQTGHSTAYQAAKVAKEAGAKRLLLGHFSARYNDPAVLETEARTVFPHTEAAEELTPYSIPAYLSAEVSETA